ncbi:zf-HC2 domain-containing protein [Sphaerisporangium aureirubrum]|uniref:Zf-HC2 domain-containing protein n=1 Tax=Sphaerisporangium aureirubrum TaxID=1544736 RepID=A0ABW1NLU6_9ACTN
MDSPPHVEVAAYILGVLNDEDSAKFDLHLLDCASCQDELRDMYDLPDALDLVKRDVKRTVNGTSLGTSGATAGYRINGAARDTGGGPVSEPIDLHELREARDGVVRDLPGARDTREPIDLRDLREARDGVVRDLPGARDTRDGEVRDLWTPSGPQTPRRHPGTGHRRRADDYDYLPGRTDDDELSRVRDRRRNALWLGVAAAMVVAVAGVTTAQVWPRDDPPVVAAPSQTGSSLIREGTSPDTGVSGSVGMVTKSWGTEVNFQLSGVTGPERCSLIAISHNGDRDVVSGWRVPPGSGFGVPGHPDPLRLTGATALAASEIAHFEVRRDDGVRLLDIPVA